MSTLKEKFKSLNTDFIKSRVYYRHNAYRCEKIADNYAIEFKNWCDKIIIEKWIDKTTKELLEIFKKQKGY